jgi:hypothetical protein
MESDNRLEIEEVPDPTTKVVEVEPPVIAETETSTAESVPIRYEATPEVSVSATPSKTIKRRKRRA